MSAGLTRELERGKSIKRQGEQRLLSALLFL